MHRHFLSDVDIAIEEPTPSAGGVAWRCKYSAGLGQPWGQVVLRSRVVSGRLFCFLFRCLPAISVLLLTGFQLFVDGGYSGSSPCTVTLGSAVKCCRQTPHVTQAGSVSTAEDEGPGTLLGPRSGTGGRSGSGKVPEVIPAAGEGSW